MNHPRLSYPLAGDWEQSQVWPPAGLWSHSAAAFLHRARACSQTRSQTKKGGKDDQNQKYFISMYDHDQGLLGPKKELWDLLQKIEKLDAEAADITASVRDLPTVRTTVGRARAWLRLALMQVRGIRFKVNTEGWFAKLVSLVDLSPAGWE